MVTLNILRVRRAIAEAKRIEPAQVWAEFAYVKADAHPELYFNISLPCEGTTQREISYVHVMWIREEEEFMVFDSNGKRIATIGKE